MNIRPDIQALHDEITEYRHLLHENPQTAYEETFASGLVAKKLKEWGIPFETEIAVTGIVATIEGKTNKSGKAIGLRADMDALDIFEELNKPWVSKTPGKMHACGHDGHTACMLGAAKYLKDNNNFDGTVYLIFQPAEEGAGGADKMIEEGLLERFPCDEIYAIHNWPWLERGKMAMCAGPMMAGSSRFTLTIQGVGGHAAQPEKSIDPIVIGGQIVTAVQTLVSRYTDPARKAVVSITNFNAGTGAHNIIPEEAQLLGSVRTFGMDSRQKLRDHLSEISHSIGRSMGAAVEFDFRTICEPMINDAETTKLCEKVACNVVGEENVNAKLAPLMVSEDFGAMLRDRPGTYILIGQMEEENPEFSVNAGLHTPDYDFNDAIIPITMEYWAQLVETALPLKN